MNLLFITEFTSFRITDILDILLVALLLFQLFRLMRGTAAINIFLGIVAIYFIWKLVSFLQMELLSEILGQFVSVGVIALIVVFQREIRQFLLLIGTPRFLTRRQKWLAFWKFSVQQTGFTQFDIVVDACREMASEKNRCPHHNCQKKRSRRICEYRRNYRCKNLRTTYREHIL